MGLRHARAHPDVRAALARVHGGEHHEPGVIHRAVGIFKTPGEGRFQRFAGLAAGQIERPGARQKLAPAEMIIEKQPQPDQPRRAQARMMGQHEAHGRDDVRRGPEQHFALAQRLAHKAEFVMLQIAQSSVNELGGGRGRAGGQIVHFRQNDRKPAPGRVARDAAAVNAAADDGDVMNFSAQGFSALLLKTGSDRYETT